MVERTLGSFQEDEVLQEAAARMRAGWGAGIGGGADWGHVVSRRRWAGEDRGDTARVGWLCEAPRSIYRDQHARTARGHFFTCSPSRSPGLTACNHVISPAFLTFGATTVDTDTVYSALHARSSLPHLDNLRQRNIQRQVEAAKLFGSHARLGWDHHVVGRTGGG